MKQTNNNQTYDPVEHMANVQNECQEKIINNHDNYVANFKENGAINILSNLSNKMSQIQVIKPLRVKIFDTKKLREYLIDIHNYSAMAIVDLDKKKESQSNTQINTPANTQTKANETNKSKNETNKFINQIKLSNDDYSLMRWLTTL